jgi:hypothetical protein|tara:strand:+ start:1056 stop:1568 length:513 start_codon:yes stop_codon:yes gene_type:complete
MAFLDTPIHMSDIPKDESTGSFEPIPSGTYDAIVQGIDLRKTKAGTGQYLACRLDVTGPTQQGRVLWANLNISNPNPKAEEIGRRQLGELMKAAGVSTVEDTDQLLGGRLSLGVQVKEDEKYGKRNEVKKMTAKPGGASAAPMPSASGAKSSAPPWAAKKEAVAEEDIPF